MTRPDRPTAPRGFSTRAIKASTAAPRVDQQPNSVPIYQTVTFSSEDAEELGAISTGQQPGYAYARLANPTGDTLAAAIAELEGAEAGAVFASGMAAIHAALLSVLEAGDRVVATRAIYGSTRTLLTERFGRLGVDVAFVDATDLAAVDAALAARPTRVLYVETISNPTIVVADLAILADLAHRNGALLIVDNTFASPFLCRPLELGADLVIESLTKYVGGHSDALGGSVCGSRGRIGAVRRSRSTPGRPSRPSPRSSSCAGSPRSPSGWSATPRPPGRWPPGSRRSRASSGSATPTCRATPSMRSPRASSRTPAGCSRSSSPVGRRRPGRRWRLHRRADDPGADRLARERPHDRRPPADDDPSPAVATPRSPRPGSAPGCSAARSASRTSTTSWPTSPRRSRQPGPRGSGRGSGRDHTRRRFRRRRRRLGDPIATLAADRAVARGRPDPVSRLGRAIWRLLTSVDFAVVQIIVLVLMAVVGMTIRQLPGFAFRSPSDYAAAMADIHAHYDPVLGAGLVDLLERAQLFQVFSSWWFSAALVVLTISIVCCTLDRTPRLWRQATEIRVVQPDPFYDPSLPDRARDGRPDAPKPCGRSSGRTGSASGPRARPTARSTSTATATAGRSWRRC